jgi:hypothetical protein
MAIDPNPLESPQPEAPPPAVPAVTVALPAPPPVPPAAAVPPARDLSAWLSVAIATIIGEGLRLWYVLQIHPPASYLHSDMLGNVQRAYSMSDAHHRQGPLDVYVPRGISALAEFALHFFPDRSVEALSPIQALLGAAVIPLLFIATRRYLGRWPALVACWLWALDFLPIGYAGFFMAETYLSFLLVVALVLLSPTNAWRCLAAGVTLGFACLFKGYALLLVGAWAALILFKNWRAAVALMVGAFLVVIPESINVSRIAGRPALLSTNGGQIFYSGHCPIHLLTCVGPAGTWVAGAPTTYQLHPEWPDVQINVGCYDAAAFYKMGWMCTTQMGWRLPGWALEQIANAFGGWPGHAVDPWPVDEDLPGRPLGHWFNIATAALTPLALFALWRRRRELNAWIVIGAPFAMIIAVALLFMGDPRYREPFDAFLLVGAAAGAVELVTIIARRRTVPTPPQVAPPPTPEVVLPPAVP